MRQFLKNKLKEQKGFTLIELLAVIVILGILAAIAIPSILGLIDNTKKDAHISNAQQVVNAARTAVASINSIMPAKGETVELPLEYLVDKGYLESVKDPDGSDYPISTLTYTDATNVFPVVDKAKSYVEIKNLNNKIVYKIKLLGNKRQILLSPIDTLKRENVVDLTADEIVTPIEEGK